MRYFVASIDWMQSASERMLHNNWTNSSPIVTFGLGFFLELSLAHLKTPQDFLTRALAHRDSTHPHRTLTLHAAARIPRSPLPDFQRLAMTEVILL